MSEHMVYAAPGAGSVALACNHGVRYPDICELCNQSINKQIKYQPTTTNKDN
jgi:hypothetical protein